MNPPFESDRDLILGLKLGNRRCFQALFVKYYPRFKAYIQRLVPDRYVCEDMLQNIFLKVWDSRESLDENLSIVAYLYVGAKYEILNYRRSNTNHPSVSLIEGLHEFGDTALGVDSEYDYNELYAKVQATINAMPPQRKRIFIMNRYEYRTAAEIAAVTGLSRRTVEKHIELALKTLRAAASSLF